MISPNSVPLLIRFPRIEAAMSESLCCPVNEAEDVELEGGGWWEMMENNAPTESRRTRKVVLASEAQARPKARPGARGRLA